MHRAWLAGGLLVLAWGCTNSSSGSSSTGTGSGPAASLTNGTGPISSLSTGSASTGTASTGGTTGATLGDECQVCKADSDCGPGGFCVAIIGGLHCTAPCGSDRSCADPGSTCHVVNDANLNPIGSGCLPSANMCPAMTLGSTAGANTGSTAAATTAVGTSSSSTATTTSGRSSTTGTSGSTGTVGNLSCSACQLANPSCPSGQTCTAVRDTAGNAAISGFCALPCDTNTWACADPTSTCVNAGGTPTCFPWGCMGLGTSQTVPAPEPWPQVPNQGGTVLTSAQVVVVMFQAYSQSLQTAIPPFVQEMVSSSFLSTALGQYGVSSVTWGGSATLTETPPTTIDDTGIQSWLSQRSSSGQIPAPGAGTVYLVFFPSTTTVFQDPNHTQQSCQAFVGYHGPAVLSGPLGFYYGVIPDCGPNGFGQDELQSVEMVAAHEAAEAITDPDGSNQAWIIPSPQESDSAWAGLEIADLCQDISAPLGAGSDVVQRLWSNQAAGSGMSPCQPNPASGFSAVSSLPYQLAASAGQTIRFPLIGLSTQGDTSVSFNAVGSADFINAVATGPGNAPVGQVTPFTLKIPSSAQGELDGEIVSLDAQKQIQAFWRVYVVLK